MDKDKDHASEVDMELHRIKNDFDVEYVIWWSKNQNVSSSRGKRKSTNGDSSATPPSSGTSKGSRSMTSQVETNPELPDKPIRGFVNESLFLKNFLLKRKGAEEFKTLAIVGKFGVGKTTLCQNVFNDKEVKEAYLPRIWVSMYSHGTKEDEDQKVAVLRRMLRSLGVEDEVFEHMRIEADEEKRSKDEAGKTEKETVEDKELLRLLDVLHSNLYGKKYLIVLDDVWEDNEWNQRLDDDEKIQVQEKTHLSCGFPKGFGGRVIVTSRDEGLAKKIVGDEENVQRLFPRSDVQSVWEIYKDAFGEPMEDADGAVEKVVIGEDGKETKWVLNPRYPGRYKNELMDKSGGVPLAAQMLAKIVPLKIDEDKDM